MIRRNFAKDILLGIATGDALGVPVEFIPRKELLTEPVTGMRAFGTHRQPAGTWSDDSSLTFCLAEMLCKDYDLEDLARKLIDWEEHAYWTAHGEVFDMGIATSAAIHALKKGGVPALAGGAGESSNGNGSLMRILPLLLFIKDKHITERFCIVQDVSSLTHRHIRSVIGCFIYLEMALLLLAGKEKQIAYDEMVTTVNGFLLNNPICPRKELDIYHRILCNPIGDQGIRPLYESEEKDIHSTGYVLHTLEASLWCLLRTNNYAEAVLKAVNLGHDTDTTGAVTGGLAGLLYGCDTIPSDWLAVLARENDIEALAERLYQNLFKNGNE